ncbi:MAG: 4-hydroxy-tetrahydrodipicolinate synthase [Flavobacteriaceae bacterium]
MKELLGTGVALVTPFSEDGSVDTRALAAVVEHCIAGGVDYLVVLGTTAESATLEAHEKQLVIDTVVSANAGRLPLVLGIGGNHTASLIKELTTRDLEAFSAILSVSPYYNKPTQEGIYQHFGALAEVSPKPLILYNVPSRTGSNMLPATVLRLAEDFGNIVAIKEASGDLVQIQEIIDQKPNQFLVISGDDLNALPTVLAGGAGVISVLGQGLPTEFSNMVRLALNKASDEAYDMHYALLEGMHLIFEEGNPAGIKSLLSTLGLCGPHVRLPLVAASSDLQEKIRRFVQPFAHVAV